MMVQVPQHNDYTITSFSFERLQINPLVPTNVDTGIYGEAGIKSLISYEICYYITFLLKDTMHSVDYAVSRCLSVRLSHAGILSKWLDVSSNFFHQWVKMPFQSFLTKRYGHMPTGTALMADHLQGGKTQLSTNILLYHENDTKYKYSHSYHGRQIKKLVPYGH